MGLLHNTKEGLNTHIRREREYSTVRRGRSEAAAEGGVTSRHSTRLPTQRATSSVAVYQVWLYSIPAEVSDATTLPLYSKTAA